MSGEYKFKALLSLVCFVFKITSCCVIHGGLKFMIFLPQSLKKPGYEMIFLLS